MCAHTHAHAHTHTHTHVHTAAAAGRGYTEAKKKEKTSYTGTDRLKETSYLHSKKPALIQKELITAAAN